MKNNMKWNILLYLMLCWPATALAQDSIANTSSLETARLRPYRLQVTYQKTSHLLFPSPIRYVDLGSDLIVASKADPIANVLRIKSAVQQFDEETNFSVITEDGQFYSFDVLYNSYPETLSYDLVKMQRHQEKTEATDVLFEDLKGSSSSLTEMLMKKLYDNPTRQIRHIGSKSYGILFSLKALYVHNSKFYFIIDIRNSSQLSYEVDYISFTIADKKNLKRTVVQDKVISPLRTYPEIFDVDSKSRQQSVFLLNQFTLLDSQILEIELFEKNGGRHQKLEISNKELVNASLVDQLHLKLD